MGNKKPQTVARDLAELGNFREQIIGDGLPNIDKINVPVMTEEELERIKEEYEHRRAFAEEAGKKLAIIDREIAGIEADPERLALTPTLQRRLAELKAIREKLLVENKGVREHTEFAALLESVRKADLSEAGDWVLKAVAANRIRQTTRTSGKDLLFWAGKVYEPVPDSTGKVTAATLGLVAELRKLTDAAKVARRDAYHKAVADIKSKTAQVVGQLMEGDAAPGPYYGYLPGREEEGQNGEVRRIPESHFLVEYDGRVVKPVEAVGRLRNFWVELVQNGRFVTISDLRGGRLTGVRLSEDVFKELVGFLGILRAAMQRTPNPKPQPPAPLVEEPPVAPVAKKTATPKAVAKKTEA